MTTTTRQDADFIKEIIPSTLLEFAMDWIADNLEPEDVFGTQRLFEWAEDNGYVKEES